MTITGPDPEPAFRHALFMTATAITTTGFQNVSLQLWASVSMMLLMILMFIGCSSGSASGGVKLYRVLLGYRGVIWCNQTWTPLTYSVDSATGKPKYTKSSTPSIAPGAAWSAQDLRSRWQLKIGLRLSF